MPCLPPPASHLFFFLILFLLPPAHGPATWVPTLFGVPAPEAAQHDSPGGGRVQKQPQGPREHGREKQSAGSGHGGACSGRARAARGSRASVLVGLWPSTESPPRLFRDAPLLHPAGLPGPPALSASPLPASARQQEPKREGSEDRSQGERLGECWTPGAGTQAAGALLRCPLQPHSVALKPASRSRHAGDQGPVSSLHRKANTEF